MIFNSTVKRENFLKILLPIAIATIVISIFYAGAASAHNATRTPDWTMMVYMCRDNDLDDIGYYDAIEIENSQASNVDVLVLKDYNTTFQDDTYLQHVNNGNSYVYNHSDIPWLDHEENMGDGDTLYDFVNWSVGNFPSDRYFLVLWDHGSGVWGCCNDDNSGGEKLRMEEIRGALSTSMQQQGIGKIDIIHFDACLMGNTEVCFEVQEFGDYIIGSEKVSWGKDGYGTHFNFKKIINEMNTTSNAEYMAKWAMNQAMNSSENNHGGRSHTWSVIDIDEMTTLNESINSFAEELMDNFYDYAEEIYTARNKTEDYQPNVNNIYVDLYDFAYNIFNDSSLPTLLRTRAWRVIDAIDGSDGDGIVVLERHHTGNNDIPVDNAHGITIYFPPNKMFESIASYNDASLGVQNFTNNSRWDEWLSMFFNTFFVDDNFNSSTPGWGIDHFDNIQDALGDAGTGDTIRIFSGIYHEPPGLTIDKSVKLVGDGPLSTKISDTPITIMVDNVSISSCRINNTGGSYVISVDAENVTISNCYLLDNNGSCLIGVDADNLVVQNCAISQAPSYGIELTDSDYVQILDNHINYNRDGIYLDSSHHAQIYAKNYSSYVHDNSRFGIYIWSSINTEIYGEDHSCCLNVQDNGGDGIVILSNSYNSSISNYCRIFNNNGDGIHIQKSNNTTVVDCDIGVTTYNGGYGIYADSNSLNTDARFNYWGDASGPGAMSPGSGGPGSGDEITSNVNYSPWLGYPAGTLPQAFYVDSTGKIQDAIDHATSGDSVLVFPGTYVENVLVWKSHLTISGYYENDYPIISGRTRGNTVEIKRPAHYTTIERFNISVSSRGNGVYIYRSSYATVSQCNVHSTGGSGINFSCGCSHNGLVTECQVNLHDLGKDGIVLGYSEDGGRYYCGANNITITDCHISNCVDKGISIKKYCRDNTIADCGIFDNGMNGVFNKGNNTDILNCNIYDNGMGNDGAGIFCHPNSSADWEIDDTTSVSNNDIRFKGDINVLSGGLFNFSNARLNLHCESSSSPKINVYGSGEMNIRNSNISNPYTSYPFTFVVRDGATFTMADSELHGCGYADIIPLKWGLYIAADNSKISNCSISDNHYGIVFSYSENNTVQNCDISNNILGIKLRHYSNNNTIVSNTISDNDYGVNLTCSVDNLFYHNNFNNNIRNAYCDDGNNTWHNTTVLEGNYWHDYTGLDLDDDGIGDTPYTVPGPPVQHDEYPLEHPYGSITNLDTKLIFLTIQLAVDDTSTFDGHTIYVKNHVYYENVYIDKAIKLIGEDRNMTIIDGSGIDDTVYVDTDHVSVSGFTLRDAPFGDAGIDIRSSYNSITDNKIQYNGDGIYLKYSNNNTITNNIIRNNHDVGLRLSSASNSSSYNIITDNKIQYNGDGIYLKYSNNNTITNNIIRNNHDVGLRLSSASNNTITGNNATSNDCGIWIDASGNNTVYDNVFKNINNVHGDGDNIWNISKISGVNIIGGPYLGGNYWGDYTGVDVDGDGLGDTHVPYRPGDQLPLTDPNYAPTASFTVEPMSPSTVDVVYFNSTSSDSDGNIMNWTWDMHDGTTLYGEEVIHSYTDDGSYNVTLTVEDDDGAEGIAHFTITVYDMNPPVTVKMVGQPSYGPDDIWVTSSTQFTFTAFDNDSGVNHTYYRIWCNGNWTPWAKYTGSFTLSSQCSHYLEYYSVDNAGNVENITNHTHYVDDTPPVATVDSIQNVPAIPFAVTATASDDGCNNGCGVDQVTLWFRYSYDNVTWSNWILYGTDYAGPWEWMFCAPPNGSAYYQFYATAIDHLGNEEAQSRAVETSVYVPQTTHTCSIYQGWNLITVSMENDYTASSLGQNISGCTIVAYYNATSGMFESFLVGVSPPSADFVIEDGVGYFVYMATDTFYGGVDIPISNVSVDLSAGWNTLGWCNTTATSASGLGTAINNCTIVAYWNASSSTFQSYLVGISPPSVDFHIERGMGVFVYVTKPGVWHGEG